MPIHDEPLPQFSLLGVRIHNLTRRQAVERLDEAIGRRDGRTTTVFFVNAHTLNLAADDPDYRAVLNRGDLVLADGTGVRWAARLQGVRVAENLNGTDFAPALFESTVGRDYSYFLLGADAATIPRAADYARQSFQGWSQAGFHDGYLTDDAATERVIERIHAARPDVLLVGMGNPIQERWIMRNLLRLEVPVCMGVGGLFDFWAGNVRRAPRWIRRMGQEWAWRLVEQPRQKARRYLIGNPLFLARVLRRRE
jgi:N-acetylglucosaminyldiphosphoundecaprenol N-acetyl-beta-D-mannosaminyltransferase